MSDIGYGRSFDDLQGNSSHTSQLTVTKAADGFVYIMVIEDGKANRFIATDEMAMQIAIALKAASK